MRDLDPRPVRPEADPALEDGSEEAGAAQGVELLGLFLRAPRRRPLAAALTFVLGLAATAAVVSLSPRVYVSETKILAQRNVVIPSLSNPHRAVPADWDAPTTRAASESILRRDNLAAIAEETELPARWNAGRSPLSRALDNVSQRLFGPTPEEERYRAILGTLEKRLTVQSEEPTIKISAAWSDPEIAYRIAQSAQRNFLRDRAATEMNAITESTAILEQEAVRQREAIDVALGAVRKIRQAAVAAATPPAAATEAKDAAEPRFAPRPARAAPVDHEVTAELAEKRRAIQNIEDTRQRRLAELRAQLADLRGTYASQHPSVIALEEKIRQASVEPPELASLKRAEAELLARIKLATPFDDDAPAPQPARRLFAATMPAAAAPAAPPTRPEDDPEAAPARAKLVTAVQRYEELMDRIDSARIELITAQAAFKYRYVVVEPAEVPKRAQKPNIPFVVAVGFLASILAAIGIAGARDLASGRFVEAWQVRRKLAMPVLAEVERPS
jgi:uncharacterized protein involved in exopolysaccharide biosynthesis